MHNSTERQFLEAYDQYAPALVRHAYFRVSNWDIAEDLAQETFLKTWKYITSHDDEIKNIRTFLYTVINNLVIDHYRQKYKQTTPIDAIAEKELAISPDQEEEVNHSLNKKFIEDRLLSLKPEHREILVYRYIDDFRIKEISEITGKSEGNIKVIIHRSIKLLQQTV